MRKIDLMGLFEIGGGQELGDGARMVDTQEIIEIKKESVEMILVIQGGATVIFKEAGKKEIASISRGEACFFGANDESVMLQEGSLALVLDKRIRKDSAVRSKRTGFFGKREKVEESAELESAEPAGKKSILSDMLPKVRQSWLQVAGPLSSSVVNDEERFKGLASTVYAVLPMPVRMVVKEEFFVNWCYEKRHVLLVEMPEPGAVPDDQLALLENEATASLQAYESQEGDKVGS